MLKEYRYPDGNGMRTVAVTLIECPACGYEFSEKEPRWKHFLHDHLPEDFGLSPLDREAQTDDFRERQYVTP